MTPTRRDSPAEIIEKLRPLKLFESLQPGELEKISQAAAYRQVEADTFLFFQGDPAERFYLLLEGRVKLTQVTPEGNQVILRYASPGEAFAVVAVLSDMHYPVSAQTAEHSAVLTWDKETMRGLMLRFPQLAINALSILGSRAREFQDRVRELSTERVERRIARALLRLLRQAGRRVEQGILIDLALTRQDIAEMTGTTLYTVSRTISQWENQGLVKAGREQIIIVQPHGLVVIAEDLPQDQGILRDETW